MSFILTLHITGLCAIVPNGKETLVVLPNARDFDHDGCPLPRADLTEQHIPILCLPNDSSISIQTQRPGFPIPPASGLAPIPLLAFPLDMEDVRVSPYDPVPVALPPPTGDQCHDPAHTPANHFGWICDMKEAGVAAMDPQLKSGPLPPKVIARIHVGQGIWSTDVLAASILDPSSQDLYVVRWWYADIQGQIMHNSPVRAIADVVQVEIPIEDRDTATFESSAASSNIVARGTGDDFDAYLANVPLTTLFGVPAGVRSAEYHFAHFFRLAPPQPPPDVYVPTPDISNHNCGRLRPGTEVIPHCPPAQFEV
jgi:hypothetical protein